MGCAADRPSALQTAGPCGQGALPNPAQKGGTKTPRRSGSPVGRAQAAVYRLAPNEPTATVSSSDRCQVPPVSRGPPAPDGP